MCLHSIMFLLIRYKEEDFTQLPKFTFHYVSINTILLPILRLMNILFTFHYVSINTPSI